MWQQVSRGRVRDGGDLDRAQSDGTISLAISLAIQQGLCPAAPPLPAAACPRHGRHPAGAAGPLTSPGQTPLQQGGNLAWRAHRSSAPVQRQACCSCGAACVANPSPAKGTVQDAASSNAWLTAETVGLGTSAVCGGVGNRTRQGWGCYTRCRCHDVLVLCIVGEAW